MAPKWFDHWTTWAGLTTVKKCDPAWDWSDPKSNDLTWLHENVTSCDLKRFLKSFVEVGVNLHERSTVEYYWFHLIVGIRTFVVTRIVLKCYSFTCATRFLNLFIFCLISCCKTTRTKFNIKTAYLLTDWTLLDLYTGRLVSGTCCCFVSSFDNLYSLQIEIQQQKSNIAKKNLTQLRKRAWFTKHVNNIKLQRE